MELVSKPNILYEFLHLSSQALFIIYLLLIIACVSTAGWVYVVKKRTTAAYRIVMGGDIGKFALLLLEDLKKIEGMIASTRNIDATVASGTLHHIERMKMTLDKMNHYLKQELEKITKPE